MREEIHLAHRLAIGGRSAGGITVGRALTERPDLFAAVIDGVGWSNPLRYVADHNATGEEPEWGAIAEEAGYRTLKLIDSYQAVKTVRYPAVLLTTGVPTPRRPVPRRENDRAAAGRDALGQAHTAARRLHAGHGVESTRVQQDREAADAYAFLLWQTGVKGEAVVAFGPQRGSGGTEAWRRCRSRCRSPWRTHRPTSAMPQLTGTHNFFLKLTLKSCMARASIISLTNAARSSMPALTMAASWIFRKKPRPEPVRFTTLPANTETPPWL